MGFLSRTQAVTHALLDRIGRPLRRSRAGDLVIEGYRGFGTRREFHLLLRVTRSTGGRWDGHAGDLRASLKRLFRRGVGGQVVTARFGNDCARLVTDDNGYGRMRLSLTEPVDPEPLWHRVTFGLDAGNGTDATVDCDVLVAPQTADLLIVSDIDDTVMLTGVASKLRMFWRLFARGARSRLAFPGAAALYRAFHGPQRNPIIYVSRSPWSIYAMLDAFFRRHGIPVGPVMFLRDWGVSWRSPLPRRATEHKADVIREILDLYQDLPVVLIGDSGQRDPEIYAQIVREHPGQVRAVYIRDVSNRIDRSRAIESLAEGLAASGASLLLAADTVTMARHAAELGLVPADTPRWVAEDGGGARQG